MSEIENTGLLEDWRAIEGRRIFGKVHDHRVKDGPGKWSPEKDMMFSIQSKHNWPLRKGDVIRTNTSILVLGNPHFEE